VRLPQDVSGGGLIRALGKFGCEIPRQTGSHVRLTTHQNGTHNLTIPLHDPLRIGTFASILDDVSRHLEISRDSLLNELDL
jgi:predicted RNA binding protein YcfA (HicA-like mRNA interferase family)